MVHNYKTFNGINSFKHSFIKENIVHQIGEIYPKETNSNEIVDHIYIDGEKIELILLNEDHYFSPKYSSGSKNSDKEAAKLTIIEKIVRYKKMAQKHFGIDC